MVSARHQGVTGTEGFERDRRIWDTGAMLLKAEDRMTADGFLGLRAIRTAGESLALATFLETVLTLAPRDGELPFHTIPAQGLRFFSIDKERRRELSWPEARALFFPEPGALPVLLPATHTLRLAPNRIEDFLASKAHESLAFTPEPLLMMYLIGPEPRIAVAQEGRVGHKYERSKQEVLDFLKTHPGSATILSDLEMRLMGRVPMRSLEDLSRFMDENPSHLDGVIDQVQMVAGYFFDEGEFGSTLSAKRNWFLALNKDAYATVDFQISAVEANVQPLAPVPFTSAKEALSRALSDIAVFAGRQGLQEDHAYFERVRQGLDQPVGDLSPLFRLNGLAPEAYALFRAAIDADVFAGMASWNDVQIDKTPEYRRVSNQLCLSLLDGLCAACSSGL